MFLWGEKLEAMSRCTLGEPIPTGVPRERCNTFHNQRQNVPNANNSTSTTFQRSPSSVIFIAKVVFYYWWLLGVTILIGSGVLCSFLQGILLFGASAFYCMYLEAVVVVETLGMLRLIQLWKYLTRSRVASWVERECNENSKTVENAVSAFDGNGNIFGKEFVPLSPYF